MPQPYPNGELVIVVDCSDLDRSARFWCGVLGYTASPPSSRRPTKFLASGPGELGRIPL
jgi:Glyoxalase-like domain